MLPAAASAAADPAAPPPGVSRGVSVEGVDEYKLSNGLKILLFPDPTKPTITVNITYMVGSRNENYGETGMAHLLEHMMFKGSPRHANIPQELTAHGSSSNGSTSYDHTNYFETFSATDQNLDWALDLEADRMVKSFIAKKDLDSEMMVVRNELEKMENNPSEVLTQRVMATAYLWHNYGKDTLGARTDIESVQIERLQAFYRNWYQPDNAVLIVAGDFDPAKTLPLIQQKFGAIAKPARVLQKTYTQDPTQDGERLVTLRRVGNTQEAMAIYHVPAASSPDSAALDILAYILGDTPSGRLYKALVETKKASAAYGLNYSLREAGLMIFDATVRKENSLEEARDIMLNTVEGAALTAFNTEDVERARVALLNGIDLTLKSSVDISMNLSASMAEGDWRLFFIYRDRIKAVTVADIKRVAAAYLKSSNRTMGLFYPTENPDLSEIPSAPDVTALVENYKGEKTLAAGEAFDNSTGNIDKRTIRTVLKSGLKLALLSKKTRGSTVQVILSLDMGTEQSLKGLSIIKTITGQMLMRGTGSHTRQQLQDTFDQLKTNAYIGDGTVRLETDRINLSKALQLAAEVLRKPSFPKNEFETLKQELLASIENEKNQPKSIANTAFMRHLNPFPPDDLRYVPTPDEAIEWIKTANLDAIKTFHKDFYGASSGQLAIVGDFDQQEITALAEELFGGWTSLKPYVRIETPFQDVAPAQVTFETPNKANAYIKLGIKFAMREDDPDYPALLLANFMAGGGFHNSRLPRRIREKEGLSYRVASYLRVDSLDKHAEFTADAIFNPQNLVKVEKAFREELSRMIENGFTANEIQEAKDGWLQARKVERSQDQWLASRLAHNEYLGRTMAWSAELERKITALTPQQLQDTFARHIVPAKFTFVQAGDFAGVKAKEASSTSTGAPAAPAH
ncbi:MAG: pseudouridine synthase [Elusimicrobia bacterium RIFOXYA12_FULL_51_18]|nr:MAG: pseudouridine synthase [Elusimicrobia bacterium RIFOXYA12_FULL_51_18]OGS32421.1 MAG: pseudouridine synthase [Elusimicrobia bacterium RIFOXYA2_FULL_53_38]